MKSKYWYEVERVRREVWSLVGSCGYVVDVGVSESTRELAKRSVLVVGIDVDPDKVVSIDRSKGLVELVAADFLWAPLRKGCADLVVFHFTLHEINPKLHEEVIRTAGEVGRMVMIVEGVPKGHPNYMKFYMLWRESMHNIGRFEDLKPMKYWLGLIEDVGLKVVTVKNIKWRTNVPYEVFKSMVKDSIKEWRRLGVDETYVTKLKELLRDVRVGGFKWSNEVVILAESSSDH